MFKFNNNGKNYLLIVMFLVTVVAMFISFMMNYQLMDSRVYSGISTYILAYICWIIGLKSPKITKIWRVIIFVAGCLLFCYLCAYFFIGFHNPSWGN